MKGLVPTRPLAREGGISYPLTPVVGKHILRCVVALDSSGCCPSSVIVTGLVGSKLCGFLSKALLLLGQFFPPIPGTAADSILQESPRPL